MRGCEDPRASTQQKLNEVPGHPELGYPPVAAMSEEAKINIILCPFIPPVLLSSSHSMGCCDSDSRNLI